MLAPHVLALDVVVAWLAAPQNPKNPCHCPGVRYFRHRAGRDAGLTFMEDLFLMAAKPLIGINTDYRATRKEHAALSFVAAGYYDGITASGGIPVILPPLAD